MMRYLPIAFLVVACTTPTQIVYVTPEPTAWPSASPVAAMAPLKPTAAPTPEVTAEPTPTPVPVSYEAITFKAATDKTTKPFYIGTYGATMALTVTGTQSACKWALAAAFLFPAGETTAYAGELSNEKCKTTEETEVFLEPGDYYVEWLIANVQGTLVITPHD